MKINIKATNIELTGAINEYLDKRLSALDKFIEADDDSAMCYVEVGRTSDHHKTGDVFRAEINLHWHGQAFRAEDESADLYSAIDLAKDEMLRELRSDKAKRVSLIKRGGARIKDMIRGMYRRRK